MKMKVLGIQKVDYINKAGKQVLGTNLHCSFDEYNVEGSSVDKIYISDKVSKEKMMPVVKVGIMIDVVYNRFGYIDDIKLI